MFDCDINTFFNVELFTNFSILYNQKMNKKIVGNKNGFKIK